MARAASWGATLAMLAMLAIGALALWPRPNPIRAPMPAVPRDDGWDSDLASYLPRQMVGIDDASPTPPRWHDR